MPWNFFKKKKKPTDDKSNKTTKTADPKKQPEEAEDQWMTESIVQYLESPLWSNPISDFIDQNCMFFEEGNQNENVAEQLRIFGEFKKFVSKELRNIMKDLGISETQFKTIFENGLKDKEYSPVFRQLLILDYPEKFYEMMTKRNKELEHEAASGLEGSRLSTKSQDESMNSRSGGDEEEIERALIASLQLEEDRKRRAMDEDEQLQIALRLSQMEYEDSKKKTEQQSVQQPIQQQIEETKNEDKGERKQKDFKISKTKSQIKTKEEKKPVISSDESANESVMHTSDPDIKKEQPKPIPKESFDERKKRLQEQRELILAKKKAEREKEIKEYEQINGITRVEEKEAPKEKEPEEIGTDDVFLFSLNDTNVDKKEIEKRKDFFKKYKDLL